MSKERRRMKVTHKRPNPLFEQWLEEWREEAVQKNSNLQYCYSKALKSLKRFPLPLKTGKDCLILDNFGHNLCSKLDRKLEEYRRTHPLSSSDDLTDVDAPTLACSTSNPQRANKTAKKRKLNDEERASTSTSPSAKKQRSYVPAFRSGGYAILITLYRSQNEGNYPGFMTKAQLQKSAQALCDASFYKPDPGSYYTAWSSMATLIKKAFISKTGNPPRFSLTIEGTELAKQLEEADPSAIQSSATVNDENKCQSRTNVYRATPRKKTSSKGKRPLKKNSRNMYADFSENESDPDEPDAVDAPASPPSNTIFSKNTQNSSTMSKTNNLNSYADSISQNQKGPFNKYSSKYDWLDLSSTEDGSEQVNCSPKSSVEKTPVSNVNRGSSGTILSNLGSYVISSSDDESPALDTGSLDKCGSSSRQIRKTSSSDKHHAITSNNTSVSIELSDSDDDSLPKELKSPGKKVSAPSDSEDFSVPCTDTFSKQSPRKSEKNIGFLDSLSDDEFDLLVKNSALSTIDKFSVPSISSVKSNNLCSSKDNKLSSMNREGSDQQSKEKCISEKETNSEIPISRLEELTSSNGENPATEVPESFAEFYFGDCNDDDDYLLSQVQCESDQLSKAKESIPPSQDKLPLPASQSPNKYSTKASTSRGSPKKCSNSSQSSSQASDFFILMPDMFDVILLVDEQESKNRTKPFILELDNSGIKYEVRHLKVGDYIWIARCRTTNAEVVLPYIIERKRMDDLGSSIKDGRFHEQKIRLKQSGIEKLIYLVEIYGGNYGLPETTVHQAAINTYVVDCFQLKYTSDYRHSALYLATLTKLISKQFKDKTIASCDKNSLPSFDPQSDFASLMTFKDFSKGMSKVRNYTVKEMFIKHLLQLFGMSVEKAVAITDRFPTPKSLLSAFKDGGQENMLASIVFGTPKRTIGPTLSKNIYQFYTSKNFP
ncbi:unnamed protein product [Bemisia tabaci]|uniref:Crossover junction endonuclease MUS81 n=1 Tax=Bemisia tabaci TaxID=7038 RepID=A0A9P0A5X2_BEMTA|nr:unnamed protein product [Bemisia tabaci]